MSKKTEEEDYLEVDAQIPGQNFVCLSFISPENVLKQKDRFFFNSYIKSLEVNDNGVVSLKPDEFEQNFEDYISINSKDLEEEFHKLNNFQTTVRGVKIRGVYNTQEEANKRAADIQRLDRNFNVFVGQVGYWLPWDAEPSDVAENEYLEKDLNELMKQYKSNQIKKEVFYQQQIDETKKQALIDAEAKKAENVAQDAMAALGVEESKED
ncbi:hypothetical protein JO84_gp357 [Aureococcus anophagefferens virus]|uniref:Uncharacterized protein n=1 Tax=Aureococcus anophagefferens virus TaxID=1474867 RepID=A0A076FG40_9VIRU|nr:hypothetical protein JO84_gp357 [Aureococcus anophagefferens virus]AII16990.1 hypothetical protein AaV_116 [Aureococcus anophagefferens virus]UOG94414.1 hypothetical protein MKD35_380 [Aureococcus anophagefferens virus]